MWPADRPILFHGVDRPSHRCHTSQYLTVLPIRSAGLCTLLGCAPHTDVSILCVGNSFPRAGQTWPSRIVEGGCRCNLLLFFCLWLEGLIVSDETPEQLRSLFQQLREQCESSTVPLTMAGAILRKIDPSFAPAQFGAIGLRNLIELHPDLGALKQSRPGVWIVDLESPGERTRLMRVRDHVWRSVTFFKGPTSVFDLETRTFVSREDAERQLASEPERFLALPDCGGEFQRSKAREFVAQREPALEQEIEQLATRPDWYQALDKTLGARGLLSTWKEFKRDAVAGCLEAWAVQHGLPLSLVLQPRPQAVADTRPASVTVSERSGCNEQSVRRLLHEAIEGMTLPELLDLRLPLRFFVGEGTDRDGRRK